MIRVSLTLEPESDGPAETRGTVVIKVVLCLHSTRQIIVLKLYASHDGQVAIGGDFMLASSCHLVSSFQKGVHGPAYQAHIYLTLMLLQQFYITWV